MEPHKLKKWKTDSPQGDIAYFYTCARPGRSGGPKGCVSDQIVSAWVEGLPGPDTAIISLLGRKQGREGTSEFSYYSFSGGVDTSSERGSKPNFAEWLDAHHAERRILVREHPTYDYQPIPYERLTAVEAEICHLISLGRTVVIVDSGGESRTGKVCRHMKATLVV